MITNEDLAPLWGVRKMFTWELTNGLTVRARLLGSSLGSVTLEASNIQGEVRLNEIVSVR